MNIEEVINHLIMLLVFIVIIIGKMITISISKIRNRTAIIKNWDEKGVRDDLLGSNPHSKGDIFSRSRIDFFLIKTHINIMIMDNIRADIIDNAIFIITFSY